MHILLLVSSKQLGCAMIFPTVFDSLGGGPSRAVLAPFADRPSGDPACFSRVLYRHDVPLDVLTIGIPRPKTSHATGSLRRVSHVVRSTARSTRFWDTKLGVEALHVTGCTFPRLSKSGAGVILSLAFDYVAFSHRRLVSSVYSTRTQSCYRLQAFLYELASGGKWFGLVFVFVFVLVLVRSRNAVLVGCMLRSSSMLLCGRAVPALLRERCTLFMA